MRHRAPRSLPFPLPRLSLPQLSRSRLPLSGPAARGVLVAAVLLVTGLVAGVGVALQGDDAAPRAAAGPGPASDVPPLTVREPALGDGPTEAVSRSARRDAPTTTGTPSPVPTSVDPAPATELPTATESVAVRRLPTRATSPTSDPSLPADTTAPDTTASTGTVGSGAWTVAVSADEPASYECSVDGAAYEPCGATTTYTDLDGGLHTFTARATDTAGNTDPTPVELTAKVTGRR